MTFRIEIDRQECIGSGRCCSAVPKVFRLDESEVAVVIDANGDTEENVLYAARQCPTLSISLIKDGRKINLAQSPTAQT